MLGFVLSKMQMLLFAVGIAVVALMFYDFVSRIGLSEAATQLAITDAKLISDQLNNDLLCTYKKAAIPDRLSYGVGGTPFFYDMVFSKGTFGEGDDVQNLLAIKIVEHSSIKNKTPNVVAARSFATDASIVLVDPGDTHGWIAEGSGLEGYYNVEGPISLYPRAASKINSVSIAPNAFVALSEIILGKKTLYIIPCATEKEQNNCERNILRVGCYKLKTAKSGGVDVTDSTLIESCFNITTQADPTVEKSQNYTYGDCKLLFPEIMN